MPLTVVNVIPSSMSAETTRDSEPNVSVSGADSNLIVVTAFTPDPALSGTGPVFVSTDGGSTWVLNVILPGGNSTSDVTLRFAGASSTVYSATLRSGTTTMDVLRKTDVTSAGAMTTLLSRIDEDQPYVSAIRTLRGGSLDKVYVAHNWNPGAPTAQTASSETSQDAETAAAPAGFAIQGLDAGAPVNQDGPSVRTAVHAIGRVYAAFFRYTAVGPGATRTRDLVIVRDDNWASGATPFTAIADPVTGISGVNVVTGSQSDFSALLGTQRTGSQLAIAVDPRDWQIVWLAWCDGSPVANYTVHLRRSVDGGLTWSGDLRTIASATCPGVAVNVHGKVAFSYQQLGDPGTGNRWRTHLELSADAFATPPTDFTVADVPDANGTYTGDNPIGDYMGLVSQGKNFYGAFAANNTPDLANFPNGVSYLRNADFTTQQLLDLANNPVGVSIDPFFFKWIDVEPENDFYVRDWNDSLTSGDDGIEPSTHPVFYQTSDVWNRRGTLPGSFPAGQPENEDAGNGAGNIGDNWAFCRIRRNALPASGDQIVTAHFLVSKLGVGSNYVDASSLDPDVTFVDPDPTVTFTSADLGPITTDACQWHLNAVASTHLCLAVEITGPNDPYIAPSLVGNTPGWSTLTDLRILDDNNKAQRNMGLSTTAARGEGAADDFYAIAHNAALVTRDFELQWFLPSETEELLGDIAVREIGARTHKLRGNEGRIVLRDMLPGENRWVGLRWTTPRRAKEGMVLPVHFLEVVNGVPVNGFGLGSRVASMAQTLAEKVERHRSLVARFEALGLVEEGVTSEQMEAITKRRSISEKSYVALLREWMPALEGSLKRLVALHAERKDVFGIRRYLGELRARLDKGRAAPIAAAHGGLVNAADSLTTMIRLDGGDPADTLQMVRWEQDLYTSVPTLARLHVAAEVAELADRFIGDFGARKATNADYRPLLEELAAAHSETAKRLARTTPGLSQLAKAILADKSLSAAQRAHRQFLLALHALRPD